MDPDGDAVTILGLDSAPELGQVVRIGANSIEYTAYPSNVGTDEFTYSITDTFGAVATGTARVSIAPPGPPQPPLAVPDSITVEPGRTAVVDVLANDLVATGSRVSVSLVDPPEGVQLRTETGPLEIVAPDSLDGRSVEVVYRITDGLDSSQTTMTLRTAKPYNNPPIVSDAFGAAGDGDTVTADVLSAGSETSGSTSGAYDPDGPFEDLRVAQVYAPEGITTSVAGGKITVERAEQPMVVPFRVEDADGGAATGSLYVPAANSGLPYVQPDALIRLKPGEKVDEKLADYVVNPSGGPISFTLKSRMWASPQTELTSTVTGDGTFRVSADGSYAGPGAVVFEVTTGTSVDDPDGIEATLSVPVQVGETRPILRCPDDPIEVPQAESRLIDIGALCHVWTADPAQADGLTYTAAFDDGVDDLSAATPVDGVVEVTAAASAVPGTIGTLRVAAEGSNPGKIRIRVVRTPPPSLAPIRVSTLKAGETQTIDLARYLTPGVSNPVPTVVDAQQLTNLGVQISSSGSSVTIRTGAKAHGHADFRVVMSDVAGSSGPDRRVEGRISLDILGVPDRPGTPVPGKEVLDSKVSLDWRAPASNGSPVNYYEVRDQFGHVSRCGGTSCDIVGLSNGTTYHFSVRARNAVGFSEWSAASVGAMPDEPLDLVGRIRLVEAGDQTAAHPLEARGDQGGRRGPLRHQVDRRHAVLHHVQRGHLRPRQPPSLPVPSRPPQRVHDRWRPDLRLDAADRDAVHPGPADADRPGDRGFVRSGVALLARRRRQRPAAGALHGLPRRRGAARLHQHPQARLRQRRPRLRRARLPLQRPGDQQQRQGQHLGHGSADPVAGHRQAGVVGRLEPAADRQQQPGQGHLHGARRREGRSRRCASMPTASRFSSCPARVRSRRSSRSPTTSVRTRSCSRCATRAVPARSPRCRTCRPSARSPRATSTPSRRPSTSPRSPGPSRWTATVTPRRSR